MWIHLQQFGGGFSHRRANFERLNSYIPELEEKLNQVPSFSPEEKSDLETGITDLETQLATAEFDKTEAIKVAQLTRKNLEESDHQIVALTQQKDNLTMANNSLNETNKKLGLKFSMTQKPFQDKEVDNSWLSEAIWDIKNNKVVAFESELILTQKHVGLVW